MAHCGWAVWGRRAGVTGSAGAGAEVRIFVDKSRTVFAHDDNEHHMQLKIGINKWEDIQEVKINKVTSVPDVQHVYDAMFAIPDDVFAVDFVVQDFRTSKACPPPLIPWRRRSLRWLSLRPGTHAAGHPVPAPPRRATC